MRLTIGKKLLGGFLATSLLTLGLGVFSLMQLGTMNDNLKEVAEYRLPKATLLGYMNKNVSALQRYANRHLLETEEAEIAKVEGLIAQNKRYFTDNFAHYEKLIRSDADRALYEEAKRNYEAYLVLLEKALVLSRANRNVESYRVIKQEALPVYTAFDEGVDKMVKRNERLAKETTEKAQRDFQGALTMTLIALALSVASGLGIALALSRQIARNLAQVAAAAEGIAKGELDQRLNVQSQDELGDMARTFESMMTYLKEVAGVAEAMSRGDLTRSIAPKSDRDQFGNAIAKMVTNLREVVDRVRTAAGSVSAGAVQIDSASARLGETTSVQASSAEETSAAMEEMAANLQSVDNSVQRLGTKVNLVRGQSDELAAAVTQTSSSISELAASIQQVAGNVGHANQVAFQSSEAANAGEAAVAKTIGGMQAINETMAGILDTIRMLDQRSGEIGAIIEVIDDIAEQTNLLALNAAIEAARAGEAGRGFAVVADEVRKLAERSAKATREIGDLIKGIQKETTQAVGATEQGAAKVSEGMQLASHTSEALAKIKDASHQVSSLLSEVSAATNEQARASSQIVAAAEQMAGINDQVTGAVAEMNELTHTVTYATSEQRQGADQVVLAVESLNRSSQQASAATEEVSSAATDLRQQAQILEETVAFFVSDNSGTAPALKRVPQLSLPAGSTKR
ncbi:MCP four helix bundle domain-containing protein [bacterium]|nr:MCP four helix bundle domain-containing protein [bacterium]